MASGLIALMLTGCTSQTALPDVPETHPASPQAEEGMPAGNEHSASQQKKEQVPTQKAYVCPMHPEVSAHAPGRCPKCGMNLEKRAGAHAH
jgi:hypothetical protein